MKNFNLITTLFCASCFLLVQPQANAASVCATPANLVSNCGFETGTFSGWTLAGKDVPVQLNIQYGVEGTDPVDGVAPHSGTSQAYFADLVANATTLSQTLATVSGTSYTVSFYLDQDTNPTSGGGTYGNLFKASFGSASLLSQTNVPIESYTKYTFTEVASSASTSLSFTLGNDLGEFLVDDVSVTVTSAAVPEPAAWSLITAAAFLLFLTGRKFSASNRIS